MLNLITVGFREYTEYTKVMNKSVYSPFQINRFIFEKNMTKMTEIAHVAHQEVCTALNIYCT